MVSDQQQRSQSNGARQSVVLAGVLLGVASWSGLFWLIGNTLPTVPNRWAFYVLLHIALSGTALPLVYALNRRFTRRGAMLAGPDVLLRQANWVGLFGTTCAWLRIPRLLSLPLALALILALVAVEALLRLRETTRQPSHE